MRAYEKTEKIYERRKSIAWWLEHSHFLLAAVVALLGIAFWYSSYTINIKQNFLRINSIIRGERAPSDSIILITSNDELAKEYGKPLPRSIDAEVYEKLALLNPKGFFIDFSYVPDASESEANERISRVLSKIPSVISSGDKKTQQDSNQSTNLGRESIIASAAKWEMPMDLNAFQDRTIQFIDEIFFDQQSVEDRVPMVRALREISNTIIDFLPSTKFVNYYGSSGTLPHITIQEFLSTSIEDLKPRIEDKIVFIGTQNIRDTPLEEKDEEEFNTLYSWGLMYGVEIHATVASNLLKKEWIRPVPYVIEQIILFLTLGAACILQVKIQPKKAYLILGAALAFELVITQLLLRFFNIWISVAPALLLYLLVSAFVVAPVARVLSSRFRKLMNRRLGWKT